MEHKIETINIDLIGISRDVIASLDDEIKAHIKKVNLALKDKDTITYILILNNKINGSDTFEITVNRDYLHLLKESLVLFLNTMYSKKEIKIA